jgi:uncharacterized membrane protein
MSDQADLAPPHRRAVWRRPHAMWRLGVSAAAGTLAALLTMGLGDWRYAPTVGWDAMAITFSAWVWLVTWPMSDEATAAWATTEDPGRPISDIFTLSASVASLAAVGVVLVRAHTAHGAEQAMLAGLGLLSVAVSWWTVHTIYMLRYAELYYADPVGGVDFNQRERPAYRDFAYLALTLGMTFQVADTNLQTSRIRSTALRHALLSYLFGAVILAAAINLVVSLG